MKAADVPNTSPGAKKYQQKYSYHWKIILMTKKKYISFKHVKSIDFQIIMLLPGRKTRRLGNEP